MLVSVIWLILQVRKKWAKSEEEKLDKLRTELKDEQVTGIRPAYGGAAVGLWVGLGIKDLNACKKKFWTRLNP